MASRLTDKMTVNMRYTLSWCLFGFPGSSDHSAISTCSEQCGNIADGLEKNILNASATTPYDYCDVLNLLYSACGSQILPPASFPIKPSQVFTTDPPANYFINAPNLNGPSRRKKLAIDIAIPVTLLALLSLLMYFCVCRRSMQHNSLHDPESEAVTVTKFEPPSGLNPTVFHPTPHLQRLSYPPELPTNLQHEASQAVTRNPQPEREATSTSTGPVSPLSSPSRLPRMSRSSTQPSAMRKSLGTPKRTKSRVSFKTSGRISKKKKRTG
ncbi:hypothetical protein MMC29_008028 [Sticta canariensis]|nr:hypothetical protein [Sticta canariensis]